MGEDGEVFMNIDRICTSIILFEIWRWEYVQ